MNTISLGAIGVPDEHYTLRIPASQLSALRQAVVLDEVGRPMTYWGTDNGFVDFLYTDELIEDVIGRSYPIA